MLYCCVLDRKTYYLQVPNAVNTGFLVACRQSAHTHMDPGLKAWSTAERTKKEEEKMNDEQMCLAGAVNGQRKGEVNMKKWVYLFTEGNATMRELLGGKGANLAEMTNIGLPVPQGFTISTEACTQYYEDGRKINDEIMGQVMEYVA